MRTLVLVGTTVLCMIMGGAAEPQSNSSRHLSVHLVARNVYLLEVDPREPGVGHSNIAVLVGDDGLLLVDTQVGPDVQPIVAALRSISDKPIRYVVDTHCHGDHTGGNTGFQSAGATIVAQENLRKRIAAKKCDQPTALPTLTFDTELTLHVDDEEVQVIKLPTGHRDGDAIVYFKRANVVETGDAFVSSGLPFYSKYAGGNMLGVNEELHRITALAPGDAMIIPGHGPLSSMNEVRKASRALDAIRDAVAAQIAKGKTLDQIQAMNLTEPWKELIYGSDGPGYVRDYYVCLTSLPDPKFQL
jgi:cyclase